MPLRKKNFLKRFFIFFICSNWKIKDISFKMTYPNVNISVLVYYFASVERLTIFNRFLEIFAWKYGKRRKKVPTATKPRGGGVKSLSGAATKKKLFCGSPYSVYLKYSLQHASLQMIDHARVWGDVYHPMPRCQNHSLMFFYQNFCKTFKTKRSI